MQFRYDLKKPDYLFQFQKRDSDLVYVSVQLQKEGAYRVDLTTDKGYVWLLDGLGSKKDFRALRDFGLRQWAPNIQPIPSQTLNGYLFSYSKKSPGLTHSTVQGMANLCNASGFKPEEMVLLYKQDLE